MSPKFSTITLAHYFDDDVMAVDRRFSAGRNETDVAVDDARDSLLSIANRSSAFSTFRDRIFFLVTFFGFLNCS